MSRQLAALDRLRETLGYKATLERGYAVVRSEGQVITGKAAAEQSGALEIEFHDGRYRIGGAKPARKADKPKPPEQGSLF
jgi:exodeoxyribonuclease VII large subunit